MKPIGTPDREVVIIGAGVLGTSLAYHLAERGVRSLVLEREAAPAMHASGKNAGMFRQLYRHPQLTEWARRSVETWPPAARAHFKQTGSVIVGREIPGHHQTLFAAQLTSSGSPAVWCETDGLLDSASYVFALKKLSSPHAEFRFNTAVRTIARTVDGWRLELDDGSWVQSSVIANCAGAWINEFLGERSAAARVQAQAFARHLFLVAGWKKNWMPEADCGFYWDEEKSWYMRRWDPEQRLVSVCDAEPVSSIEKFQAREELNARLASTLLHALPEQASTLQLVRSWHCFRTYCADQLPIWGPDPDFPGLFWLSAFGGFGMSTSFAAAEDAADTILGHRTSKFPEFSPMRVRLDSLLADPKSVNSCS